MQEEKKFSHALIEIWRSRTFQVGMDICRIMLVIIAIMIFYKLVIEIEAVKILNSDPCEICMNKTGATCILSFGSEMKVAEYDYPELNLTIVR